MQLQGCALLVPGSRGIPLPSVHSAVHGPEKVLRYLPPQSAAVLVVHAYVWCTVVVQNGDYSVQGYTGL